jgi:hypothetical protein
VLNFVHNVSNPVLYPKVKLYSEYLFRSATCFIGYYFFNRELPFPIYLNWRFKG